MIKIGKLLNNMIQLKQINFYSASCAEHHNMEMFSLSFRHFTVEMGILFREKNDEFLISGSILGTSY